MGSIFMFALPNEVRGQNQKSPIIFSDMDHIQNAVIPALVNIFIPFGFGSYVQGDTRAGVAITLLDSMVLGMIAGGFIIIANESEDFSPSAIGVNYSNLPDGQRDIALALFGTSISIGIISKVIAISRPFIFYKKKKALALQKMYFDAEMQTAHNGQPEMYMGMGFRHRF